MYNKGMRGVKPRTFIYLRLSWSTWIALVLALSMLCGWGYLLSQIMFHAVSVPSLEERRDRIPRDHVIDDLRGGSILMLTFPKDEEPREIITVFDGTQVWRASLQSEGAEVPLTDEEWQTLNIAIDRWCETLPQFRDLAPDEPRYSVNIRCSWLSTDTRFFRVPVDHLPPELQMLIEHDPPSQEENDRPPQ
jgi:hypothetical protein